MTFIQKLLFTILPQSLAHAIKSESQSWLFRCPSCNAIFSVWDIGGIRYKAASIDKKVGVRCLHCREWHMMPLERRDTN